MTTEKDEVDVAGSLEKEVKETPKADEKEIEKLQSSPEEIKELSKEDIITRYGKRALSRVAKAVKGKAYETTAGKLVGEEAELKKYEDERTLSRSERLKKLRDEKAAKKIEAEIRYLEKYKGESAPSYYLRSSGKPKKYTKTTAASYRGYTGDVSPEYYPRKKYFQERYQQTKAEKEAIRAQAQAEYAATHPMAEGPAQPWYVIQKKQQAYQQQPNPMYSQPQQSTISKMQVQQYGGGMSNLALQRPQASLIDKLQVQRQQTSGIDKLQMQRTQGNGIDRLQMQKKSGVIESMQMKSSGGFGNFQRKSAPRPMSNKVIDSMQSQKKRDLPMQRPMQTAMGRSQSQIGKMQTSSAKKNIFQSLQTRGSTFGRLRK